MLREIVFRGALLLAAGSALAGAEAMTFTLERGRGGIYIAARGEIVPGDAQNFALVVPHATVDSRGFRHMVLGSDGGGVREAMAMAKVIRGNNFYRRCRSGLRVSLRRDPLSRRQSLHAVG
jgi:hypothetical protein